MIERPVMARDRKAGQHEAVYRERAADELLEHATVLCMTLHGRDYPQAGPRNCPTCRRVSEPAAEPTRPWWKPW